MDALLTSSFNAVHSPQLVTLNWAETIHGRDNSKTTLNSPIMDLCFYRKQPVLTARQCPLDFLKVGSGLLRSKMGSEVETNTPAVKELIKYPMNLELFVTQIHNYQVKIKFEGVPSNREVNEWERSFEKTIRVQARSPFGAEFNKGLIDILYPGIPLAIVPQFFDHLFKRITEPTF